MAFSAKTDRQKISTRVRCTRATTYQAFFKTRVTVQSKMQTEPNRTTVLRLSTFDSRLLTVAGIAISLEADHGIPAELTVAHWLVTTNYGERPDGPVRTVMSADTIRTWNHSFPANPVAQGRLRQDGSYNVVIYNAGPRLHTRVFGLAMVTSKAWPAYQKSKNLRALVTATLANPDEILFLATLQTVRDAIDQARMVTVPALPCKAA
jgi:hypothetical protein